MIFKRVSLIAISLLALNAKSIEDSYTQIATRRLYIVDDTVLHSGRYTFDSDNGNRARFSNISIGGEYFFKDEKIGFRPFVLGSIGYSNYKQRHIEFNGVDSGNIDLDSYYLRGGGGISYSFSERASISLGATITSMFNDGGYEAKGSNTTTKRAKELFSKSQTDNLYDIFTSFSYTPKYNGYKPYFIATLHYLNFDLEPSEVNSPDGWKANLRAGFFTHELTRFLNMPVKAEFYAQGGYLSDELSDVIGYDKTITMGSTLYWKVGSLIPIDFLKELDITFNIQATKANQDMDGYSVGFGLSLLKF